MTSSSLTPSSLLPSDTSGTSTDSYVALARRYRPATLQDIIGQPALVSTLSYALQSGRLAHAFLFSGVRGTGKTSTARILAKCLNCTGHNNQDTPTPTPCLQCTPCLDIETRRLLDVIEIDAASYNGVDHVRDLIETLQYQPQNRYRVIILDEIHMLSTAAFNALLKTLEEPPAFVKFIFATTNVEKLPPTILSRCQRFDLHRVSHQELSHHLLSIAQKEQHTLAPDAADLLARAAEGSVRDALSLLDRALTLAENKTVSADKIRLMLGLTGDTEILELFDLALHARTQELLEKARNLFMTGAQPSQILNDFLRITHLLTLLKSGAQSLPPTQPHIDTYQKWQEQLDIPRLSRLWSIIVRSLEDLQKAPDTMDALDMILLRIVFAAPPASSQKHTPSPPPHTPPPPPPDNPTPPPHDSQPPTHTPHPPDNDIAKDVIQSFPHALPENPS